jgi:tRNA G46 methylase TrmB
MTQIASKNSSWQWSVEPDRDRIAALVAKHAATEYRLPISSTMRAAIEPAIERLLAERDRGCTLVLDAGCGTGASTAALAERYSDAFVVGVDRSAARLRKAPSLPSNALLVRARLEEFWLMAHRAQLVFERTFLLYPNPYPKRWQIGRRWYGHPIFPTILATSRSIELRTNVEWYAAEFSFALQLCGWESVFKALSSEALTPFERKYATQHQPLWIVNAEARQQ